MSKRSISLILAICCVLAMLPGAAFPASAVQNQIHEINIPVQVNPLYADVLDVEDFADQLKAAERPAVSGGMSTMAAAEPDYVDMDTATEQVREAMKQRAETVTVYYYAADSLAVNDTVLMVLANATAHTGVSTEGDYLLWQLGAYGCDGLYQTVNGRNEIQMTYTLTYYTTADQEAEMDAAVSGVLSGLALDGLPEYDRIKGIYDYICANVTYDYDNLYDDAYMLKYSGYAALVNGTAVCQGYAVLFYRLALELGLDARVITGVQTSTNGAHAWNIVRIGDYYYNLDATWDAGDAEYDYFLTSDANFADHTRGSSYTTDVFNRAYPMSSTDYASGTCGENAYWVLENGTLTIFGEGEMTEFVGSPSQYPWYPFKDQILEVTVASGVTNVGAYAFDEYTNLQTATLGVTTINDFAFFGCTNLTEVFTSSTLTRIGGCAFMYSGLTSIHLPEGLTYIGAEAFEGSKLTSVIIPGSVTEWGNGAFQECADLEYVELCEGLTEVYSYMFVGCTSLKTVVIPSTATYIGWCTFKDCSALENVVIPDGMKELYVDAFYGCVSLTSIEIPASVELMQKPFRGCTGLTEITFLGDAPVIVDDKAFEGVTATIYYPGDNATWTEEVMQQYGGTITWVPYTAGPTVSFTDVTDPTVFYYEPVAWAVANGITTGTTPTTFSPNANCERAQIVTFLWRAAGQPEPESTVNPFEDVKETDYFYKAVLWAVENGITNGMDDTHFEPFTECTRGQAVTFLWRVAGKPMATDTSSFNDVAPGTYYYDAVNWAVENEITNGMGDNEFQPDSICTRGQIVTFLYRYMN